jgi:hypothetical protein
MLVLKDIRFASFCEHHMLQARPRPFHLHVRRSVASQPVELCSMRQLLMLQAELDRHDDARGRAWAAALRPLAEAFARRFQDFLPIATYPVRTGTHFNTAFALRLALDYAEATGDQRRSIS